MSDPYRVLEITTSLGCAVGCRYCPQPTFVRAHRRASDTRFLPLGDFMAALSTVPSSVDISFSGYAEPLVNPDCVKMIVHAHEKGHAVRIFSTLYGASPDDIRIILGLKPKLFVLHAMDDGTDMNASLVTDAYLTCVRMLLDGNLPELRIQSYGARMHSLLAELIPPDTVRLHQYHSRAGNVDPSVVAPLPGQTGPLICREFRQFRNVLLPNCDVSLCCMDFGLQHIIGNLLQNNYHDLQHGPALTDIAEKMNGKPGALLCRTCEFAALGAS